MERNYQQLNNSRFFGKDLSNFTNSQTMPIESKIMQQQKQTLDKSSFISNDDNTISQLSTQNSEIQPSKLHKQQSSNRIQEISEFSDKIYNQDINSIQEEQFNTTTMTEESININNSKENIQQQQQQQQFYSQQQFQSNQNANNFNSVGYLTNIKQNNNNLQNQPQQQYNNFFSNFNVQQKQIQQQQQQQNQQQNALVLFKLKYDNKPRQDPQKIQEYRNDILMYLKSIETRYLPKQQQICPIRASIIDWLVDISFKLRLKCETLHIAVQVYDRYLGEKQDGHQLSQQLHHLFAGSSLFMVAKYEEIYPPSLQKFSEILQFQPDDILTVEGKILNKIGFTLTFPTSLKFLEGYSLYENTIDSQQLNLAKFILQLSLHDPNLYNVRASQLASSALLVSMKLKNMQESQIWTNSLIQITGYVQDDLEDLANKLFLLFLQIQTSHGSAVYIKFASKKFDYIAINCQLQQQFNNENSQQQQTEQQNDQIQQQQSQQQQLSQ